MRLRTLLLVGGAILMGAPAVMTTLTGCSGGGTPLNNLQNFNNLQINLGNGQTGTLNLAVRGTTVTGTLVVNVPTPLIGHAKSATKALAFTIPAGTYQITGTFDAPRGFDVQGTFTDTAGHAVSFTLTGTVPTNSDTGTFTFTSNGQSVSGTIPALGNPTPTPTPAPNPGFLNGTISGATGANFTGAATFALPLKSSLVTTSVFSAEFQQSATLNTSVQFEIPLAIGTSLAAGQTYTLGGTNGSLTYAEFTTGGATARNWDATGGTLHIDAIDADIITFTLTNATVQARPADQATGTFTINGSGAARTSFGQGG